MRYLLKIGVSFAIMFCTKTLIGQTSNFETIDIQGQLKSSNESSVNFDFLVRSFDNDTIWLERHIDIELETQNVFTLDFGRGDFVYGLVANFNEINWLAVEKVELYFFNDSERYLQGQFAIKAVPFAMHSKYVLKKPNIVELSDALVDDLGEGNVVFFDGVNYLDTLATLYLYAENSSEVLRSDTANYGYNRFYADTARYAYTSDTATYSTEITHVINADTATYSDTASIVFSTNTNWKITGNEIGGGDFFVGPSIAEPFRLNTNATTRFYLGAANRINNGGSNEGFHFFGERGALFQLSAEEGLDTLTGNHFYLDGQRRAFHGGTYTGDIDSLKGMYSFAWGENVGTNGMYSAVFGKDTYGDTSYFGGAGTPYAATSGFAVGRGCRVARMSVAIGDSCRANYYRNVAIGKNVVATDLSAALGIGTNVLVTGATSWGMGNNLEVSGSFSTAMGTNASTNSKLGSFVFGDHSVSDTVKNTANQQFMVRADGGFMFYTSSDLTMGVELASGGGSWSMISDRNKKNNLRVLNPMGYRSKFQQIGIYSWFYKGQKVQHIGPMAQDFYHSFEVGEVPNYINMIDSDGITFLGIKLLNAMLNDIEKRLNKDELIEGIENEKSAQKELEERVNLLYEKLDCK